MKKSDKARKDLVELMMIVSGNEVSRQTQKLIANLCLSELVAFSGNPSVQESVQLMIDIAKEEKNES